MQLVANLAIAFEPFLPFSSEKLRKMLNMDSFDWAELGHTDLLPAGHQLGTPELLFEKIEDDVIQAQVDKLLATKKANEAATYKANPIKPTIAFEDFGWNTAPSSAALPSTTNRKNWSASKCCSSPTSLHANSRTGW